MSSFSKWWEDYVGGMTELFIASFWTEKGCTKAMQDAYLAGLRRAAELVPTGARTRFLIEDIEAEATRIEKGDVG